MTRHAPDFLSAAAVCGAATGLSLASRLPITVEFWAALTLVFFVVGLAQRMGKG